MIGRRGGINSLGATESGLVGLYVWGLINGFYRAMHFSAKRGIAIACCPSVRPSVRL